MNRILGAVLPPAPSSAGGLHLTQLPTQLPPAGRWVLLDYFDSLAAQSTPATGGQGLATYDQVDPAQLWLIDHVVVQNSSDTFTTAWLYADQVNPTKLLDVTQQGNLDTADYAAPLHLRGGSQLLVAWTNATDGAIGTVAISGRILVQAVA